MKTAVVIPTFNEAENIGKLVSEIFYLGLNDLEVIVVDDNSPDGTGKVVKDLMKNNQRVHLIERSKKMGLGTAYVAGFKLALSRGAEHIFEMDADFSHDPKVIPIFLKHAEKNDLVIGSRYLNGISIVNWPLRRLALSLLANKYVRIVTGMKLTDATSGFKCYRRKVLDAIDLEKVRSNGYSFQIEMKYKTHKKNFPIKEIPIIFVDRNFGTTKMSRKIVLEAIVIVWKLRLGLL
jgi:dolichol-phosphate mannosyltransferase